MGRFFDDEDVFPVRKPEVPLFRTVKDTVLVIKQQDPHSGITEYFIRCLAKKNYVKTLVIGKKVLINWQSLLNYLELRKGA